MKTQVNTSRSQMEPEDSQAAAEGKEGDTIEHFLFCWKTKHYAKSCGCGLLALRTAIVIFAIIDLVIGLFSALNLLLLAVSKTYVNTPMYMVLFTFALMALPAGLGIHAVFNTNVNIVAFYYYTKSIQCLTLPILETWDNLLGCYEPNVECSLTSWLVFLILVIPESSLFLCCAVTSFSYVNLVRCGQVVLANHGDQVIASLEDSAGHGNNPQLSQNAEGAASGFGSIQIELQTQTVS